LWRAGVTRKAQEKLRNFKYILKPEKSENFPAKRESCGYVVFIWEKHYPVNKRDLGTRENFSIDTYERSVTFHIILARSRL
jgi:hypothetical protein